MGMFVAAAAQAPAQAPPDQPGAPAQTGAAGGRGGAGGRGAAGRGGRGGGGGGAYPMHAQADPETIARGQQLYSQYCASCHAMDARGTPTGINLVRSQLVMDDNTGELIAPVVQDGRPDFGMPKIDLTTAQITDIAGYIHKVGASYRTVIQVPENILVGNAAAGQAFFNGDGKCNTCHSVTGDLAGIGSRMEAKQLQNAIVSGGGGRGRGAAAPGDDTGAATGRVTTATITLANGKVVTGRLDRIDDFLVTITDDSGSRQTFARNGDVPKVVVKNPLKAHIDMLPMWTDDEIHNVTAYLVTIK